MYIIMNRFSTPKRVNNLTPILCKLDHFIIVQFFLKRSRLQKEQSFYSEFSLKDRPGEH